MILQQPDTGYYSAYQKCDCTKENCNSWLMVGNAQEKTNDKFLFYVTDASDGSGVDIWLTRNQIISLIDELNFLLNSK